MSIVKGWFDKQKATDEPFAPSTSVPKSTTQEAIAYVGGLVLDAELAAIAGLTSAADKVPYFTGSGTAALADFTSYGRSIVAVANEAALKALVNLEIGTDVQAYDAELAALAGLTSAADKVPYFTGSGTAAVADFTAYGRSVVAVADEAAFKSLVNLEIGTDVQAYDVELAALAGLTSAADALPYFTGAGTAATTTLTAFGRSIIDDADEATFKATVNLEIGTDVQAYNARLADIAGITYAQGDVLYFNGSNLVKLAAGTAGYVLQTNGAGANPSWAASGVSDAELLAIAGLTSAADKGIYFTGSGTASTFDLTSFARTFCALSSTTETLVVPATGAISRVTNGADPFVAEKATNDVMVAGYAFDAATTQYIDLAVPMPKRYDGGTITATFYWTTAATAGTGNVVWECAAKFERNDDAIDAAFGTGVSVTDSFIADGDLHITSATAAITPGGTAADGAILRLLVYRDIGDAADTYTQDAVLTHVAITYTADASTDA